jgi:hypothetical protein
MQAMATARIVPADATDCLAPYAVLEPSPNFYTIAAHLGTSLTLTTGAVWPPPPGTPPGAPAFHGYLSFGGASVADAIQSCISDVHYIGEDITALMNTVGQGPGVQAAVDALKNLDLSATWDSVSESIVSSCAAIGGCDQFDPSLNQVPYPNAIISPRVLAVPVINRPIWEASGQLVIVNFLGFLVEGWEDPVDTNIDGRIVFKPGHRWIGGATAPPADRAFVQTVSLIR